MHRRRISLIFFTLFLLCISSVGATPREVRFVKGIPQDEALTQLATDRPDRVVMEMQDPSSFDLAPLIQLKDIRELVLEVHRYPGKDTLAAWKNLAPFVSEFVLLTSSLPSPVEIENLNEIGFSKILFVVEHFPSLYEGNNLFTLKSPCRITFATTKYPDYPDRDAFLSLPSKIPLLFIVGRWPNYYDSDVLNLFPNPKSIRVTGPFSIIDEMRFLKSIQKLDRVQARIPAPLVATDWTLFEGLKLTWYPEKWDLALIKSFEQNQSLLISSKIIFDFNRKPSPDEQAEFSQLTGEMDWISPWP